MAAPGNTTSLYCRAVSSNNLDINEIENSTYLLALTLLAYGNSQFCIFKFTKPIYEHHLKSPPIRKPYLSYNLTDSSFLLYSTAANKKNDPNLFVIQNNQETKGFFLSNKIYTNGIIRLTISL
jgi:hypothetical protein